jgi:hypothetical protein
MSNILNAYLQKFPRCMCRYIHYDIYIENINVYVRINALYNEQCDNCILD